MPSHQVPKSFAQDSYYWFTPFVSMYHNHDLYKANTTVVIAECRGLIHAVFMNCFHSVMFIASCLIFGWTPIELSEMIIPAVSLNGVGGIMVTFTSFQVSNCLTLIHEKISYNSEIKCSCCPCTILMFAHDEM